MIEINTDSTKITSDTIEVVDNINPVVSTENSAYVEVNPAEFTLSSGGLFAGGALTGTIPTWVTEAIKAEIQTGGSIANIINGLQILIDQLEVGVTQNITSINSANTSINSRIDTVVSEVGLNRAIDVAVVATKVTDAEATAIAVAQIGASFGGNIDAYITSLQTAYATANLAYASDVDLVSATLGNTTATVTSHDYAIVTTIPATIAAVEAATAISITDLQGQIDGSISTWFGSESPEYSSTDTTPALLSTSVNTGTELVTNALVFDMNFNQMFKYIGVSAANYNLTTATFTDTLTWTPVYKIIDPEVTWNTIDTAAGNTIEKDNHLGDLFYDNTTGYGYRFSKVDIEDSPDLGIIYTWVAVTDGVALQALEAASHAQATADGKATVYLKTASEMTIIVATWTAQEIIDNIGDLWINITDGVTKSWDGINTWLNTTNTQTVQALLDIITLDGAITAEETDRVADTLAVQQAALAETAIRVAAEASLDGLITTEEASRIAAISSVEAAYKEYSRVVTLAMADGVLTTAEQALITAAQVEVDLANARFTAIEVDSTQALEWSAGASKLVTAPDGSVTGWSFSDGSNVASDFKIKATNFSVSDGTTGYTPFSIVGSAINFLGKVTFSSISDADTTIPTITSVTDAATTANWSTIIDDDGLAPADNATANQSDTITNTAINTAETNAIDATSNFELVATGNNMVISGNTISKTVDTDSWTGGAYSVIPYTGGCVLSFRMAFTGRHFMMGLNINPTVDSNYTGIDYAMYYNGVDIYAYESGSSKGLLSTATTTDTIYTIVYDGESVHYYVNGALARSVATTAGKVFYMDSSFHSNNTVKILQWSAYTSIVGLQNTDISISADGTLAGGSGGQVTVAGIGAETPTGAQTKATAAQTTAISTAATDATDKANTAISTASSDATTKANAAEANAITEASKLAASVTGVLPAYSNVNPNTLTFDATTGTLALNGITDSTTGMVFPAFRVNEDVSDSWNIVFNLSSNTTTTLGVYVRIYEYDAELPAGKTHISNDSINSHTSVQEDTRVWSSIIENGGISPTWVNTSLIYTPTATAKWASIVVLNWSDLGVNTLFMKGLNVTKNTTVQNILDANTTTIDGGRITTNTLNADTIIAGTSMTAPVINGGTINGGTINGVSIIGSVIKGSWIDLSDSGVLTNWKVYGPGSLPPTDLYFARDVNQNLIITDEGLGPSGLGYFRLPSIRTLTILGGFDSQSVVGAIANSATANLSIVSSSPPYLWDSYTVDQPSARCIDTTPLTTLSTDTNLLAISYSYIRNNYQFFGGTLVINDYTYVFSYTRTTGFVRLTEKREGFADVTIFNSALNQPRTATSTFDFSFHGDYNSNPVCTIYAGTAVCHAGTFARLSMTTYFNTESSGTLSSVLPVLSINNSV